MTALPGEDAPVALPEGDRPPDSEFGSGRSVIVTAVNALMAAMTFGAAATMAMALSRLLR